MEEAAASGRDVVSQNLEHLKLCSDSKIVLNIGGTKFETSKKTLTAVPQSLLERMVETTTFPVSAGGVYFIDRDPTHFRLILNYLRNVEEFGKNILPKDVRYIEELKLEAEFYQLGNFKRLLNLRMEQ